MNLDNKRIGITNFKSFIEPIEATLFEKPEDFIVEEIHPGSVSTVDYSPNEKSKDKSFSAQKKEYLHACLVKKGISTFNVIDKISSELGIEKENIGVCGLKDTTGYTSQYISIRNCDTENLQKRKERNFFLKNFRYGNYPFTVRGHKGNRFTITARNLKESNNSITRKMEKLKERISEGIPNFYDQQRFGKRQNNHLIGREIVKRNFEKAVHALLTDSNGENQKMKQFREFISNNWGKWRECLEKSEEIKDIDYESHVIRYLMKTKNDYLGALKSIPIGRFFLNSYMSYMFNQALSEIISKEKKIENLEKLGFNAVLSKETEAIYNKILEREGIKLSDFKIDDRMLLKFGVKPTRFFPENFDYTLKEDKLVVKFDLGTGNYATMVLRMIFSNIEKLD